MESYPAPLDDNVEHCSRKVRLTTLEADVAYFQARLEILGEPETINQLAQQRLFVLLHAKFADLILKTQRQMLGNGRNSS